MSTEYFVPIKLNADEAAMVCRVLRGHEQFMEVDREPKRGLLLRFRRAGSRDAWPEDAEILFDPRLAVVFFGGEAADWERLLEAVQQVLATLGHACAWQTE